MPLSPSIRPIVHTMDNSAAVLNISPQKRKLLVIAAMLAAILEVLDSTIVNVSLPHMMPALGANLEQITWVLTTYVVASAVMQPLTGFISRRLGERNLLLIGISGFMINSVMCGLSTSLSFMLFFRTLQGIFGAAMIPLSMSLLRQVYPPKDLGKAMTIWGLGVMAAPVCGPTLGGIITQYASWRWIFYINFPICIIALCLAYISVPKIKPRSEQIDWLAIGAMVIGVSCLQLFLDQGNSKDWLQSNLIVILATTSIIMISAFIYRSFTQKPPAVKLLLFSERNFSISTVSLLLYCGTQFSLLALEPMMLETLFGYTALQAGVTMITLGVVSALGMITSSILMPRINVKYLLVFGILCACTGSHYLASLTLNATQGQFFLANAIMGCGLGFFNIPLSTYALARLKKTDLTEASGLYNYGRMLGTSIGISIFGTILSRVTQRHWMQMGSHINRFNPNLRLWLIHAHQSLNNPKSLSLLQQQLHLQASFHSFIDVFWLISATQLIIIPLLLLMKKVDLSAATSGAH